MTSAHHPKQEMIAILSGNRIFLYNYESITRKILKFNTSFNLGQGLISIGNYNFATFFGCGVVRNRPVNIVSFGKWDFTVVSVNA